MSRSKKDVLIELLVIQSQSGDAKALEDLIDVTQSDLYRYCYGVLHEANDAADICQETWLAVVKSLRRLDDPSLFHSWIRSIAYRKSMDLMRRRTSERKRIQVLQESFSQDSQHAKASDDGAPDSVGQLSEAIGHLPESERSLLQMFYQQQLSLTKISRSTGKTVSALKSKLFHLRKKLKKIILRSSS